MAIRYLDTGAGNGEVRLTVDLVKEGLSANTAIVDIWEADANVFGLCLLKPKRYYEAIVCILLYIPEERV